MNHDKTSESCLGNFAETVESGPIKEKKNQEKLPETEDDVLRMEEKRSPDELPPLKNSDVRP